MLLPQLEKSNYNEIPNALSELFLLNLFQKICTIKRGLLKREGLIWLFHPSISIGTVKIGCFQMMCSGVLNSREEAQLQLAQHTATFLRRGNHGTWTFDGQQIAKTTASFGLRWMYWGHSTIDFNDGSNLRLSLPFVGPSMPQFNDCICTAITENNSHLHLFLKRGESKFANQPLFKKSESTRLGALTPASRIILLGELLRVRSLYSIP